MRVLPCRKPINISRNVSKICTGSPHRKSIWADENFRWANFWANFKPVVGNSGLGKFLVNIIFPRLPKTSPKPIQNTEPEAVFGRLGIENLPRSFGKNYRPKDPILPIKFLASFWGPKHPCELQVHSPETIGGSNCWSLGRHFLGRQFFLVNLTNFKGLGSPFVCFVWGALGCRFSLPKKNHWQWGSTIKNTWQFLGNPLKGIIERKIIWGIKRIKYTGMSMVLSKWIITPI